MSTHPTLGIAGAKPRLSKSEGNGSPASKEELSALNHEYLRSRNSQMASKSALAEMELRRRMGELIPKKEVRATVQYALVCFRQRCLGAHRAVVQRLISLRLIEPHSEHAASQAVMTELRAVLAELDGLDTKASDPSSSLAELERKELGFTERERQQTPKERQGEQARATRRRERARPRRCANCAPSRANPPVRSSFPPAAGGF
jgi:hypothetical protein